MGSPFPHYYSLSKGMMCMTLSYAVCAASFLSLAWSWNTHPSNLRGILLSKNHLSFLLQVKNYIINKFFMFEIFVLYQFLILNMARLLLMTQRESLGQTPFLPFSCLLTSTEHISNLDHVTEARGGLWINKSSL